MLLLFRSLLVGDGMETLLLHSQCSFYLKETLGISQSSNIHLSPPGEEGYLNLMSDFGKKKEELSAFSFLLGAGLPQKWNRRGQAWTGWPVVS